MSDKHLPLALVRGSATGKVARATGGRPKGAQAQLLAPPLRHVHFSFLRALIEGLPLRWSWESYLAHEEGPDHQRHFASRARALIRQVRAAAAARDLTQWSDQALKGFRLPAVEVDEVPAAQPAAGKAALEAQAAPSLEDWIDQECARTGTDPDFFTQSEWIEAYEAAMLDMEPQADPGAPLTTPASPRTAIAEAAEPSETAPEKHRCPRVKRRLDALNRLAHELEKPAELEDRLAAWLSKGLASALQRTEVHGRALPLLTIDDLITFVTQYHFRWWQHVPRLGQVRGERVLRWLTPLAELLGRPLPAIATKPLQTYLAEQQRKVAAIDRSGHRVFGLVPLDRLAIPPALDGRHGEFRAQGTNTFSASDDLEAVYAWLATRRRSASTARTYPRIVERFYLWALLVKGKPLSSLNQLDLLAYRDFLARPPEGWIQRRRAGRESAEWRPFKDRLTERSQHLDMTVVASLFSSLHRGGYLRLNPTQDLRSALRLAPPRIEIDRSFGEADWTWLMSYWRRVYEAVGPLEAGGVDRQPDKAAALRRTRLVLELGVTTGLRLVELVTTRRRQIERVVVDGQAVWIVQVLGKGNKQREVVLYDDIKDLLDQHHADMQRAGTAYNAAITWRRTLAEPTQPDDAAVVSDHADPAPSPALLQGDSAQPKFEEGDLPLVGALRAAPAAGKGRGAKVQGNADRNGALDPTALYQSLKRFFRAAAKSAREHDVDFDAERLERSSTHWLRHFFANNMAQDQVAPASMMQLLGHASLQTTSIYLRQERRALVAAMGQIRRRGSGGAD